MRSYDPHLPETTNGWLNLVHYKLNAFIITEESLRLYWCREAAEREKKAEAKPSISIKSLSLELLFPLFSFHVHNHKERYYMKNQNLTKS